MLAHGFARVRCESGKDELLVAFSCKGRGVCPSCHAKRAQVTAVHLVERVLPHVPYRKWTLSFAQRVRWVLLKDVGFLWDVLTLFLRAGARPAASAGTAAGPARRAGRGRVIRPVLRLGVAGDAAALLVPSAPARHPPRSPYPSYAPVAAMCWGDKNTSQSFRLGAPLDRWSQPPVLPIALLKREMAVAGWRFVHSRYEGHRLGFMEKNGDNVQ